MSQCVNPPGSGFVTKTDKLFAGCVLFAFASWTLWCVLMAHYGAPFDLPVPPAIVRFSAFVIPSCFWLWRRDSNETDKLGVVTNFNQGILVGVVVSVVWAAAHYSYEFQLPSTVHAWLNVITLSPIAEELLFRRVVIDYVMRTTNSLKSIVANATLFALVHLPAWLLLGEKTGSEILKLLATMFVYGVVFGVLYLRTKSLWSSLIPHSVNNLIGLSIIP